MYLDYHIEIQHDAPETFSRLKWHAACGGKSRTIGTGMLKVAKGSTGTDAAQNFHNLLLSKEAFPELIQSKCNKKSISNALNFLKKSNELENLFVELKSHLDGHGFDAAAKTIIDLK